MRSVFHTFILAFCVAVCGSQAQAQLLTGYRDPPENTVKAPEVPFENLLEKTILPAGGPKGKDERPVHTYRPILTYGGPEQRPSVTQEKKGDPVDFQADNLSYDDKAKTVTASGNVFLEQAGRILRADEVTYDVGADKVQASGHVVLNEENGDIHIADKAQYQSRLQDGSVQNLRTVLNDGSRFTAETGEHKGGVKTTMRRASYTPCVPCDESDPEEIPTWGIRASEVIHDKDAHRISYRHARFELWGLPVAYTPYFSHPDGTIKQKSGFLSPSFGYKSELGAFIEGKYYWGIGPDQDATLGLMAMTNQAPLGRLEYRKRWNEASMELDGSITSSDRKDNSFGQTIRQEDETRGHVFGKARWDINDKWRSGLEVNWASDDQYLRQYDFSSENVLKNDLYAERFSGRNYASARLIAFQDIRVRDEQAPDQPDILPEMTASFKGEQGATPLLKGRWSLDASVLGLHREGSQQDMDRFSLNAGWKRRLVSDYGLLTTVDAAARGDFYYTNDRQSVAPGSGSSTSGTDLRAFPQIHMESSYPLARPFETMQVSVEPVVALTAAPKINVDDNNIPNEDSADVQIDTSNLFEPNRFPGLDRVEDQSRVTYGLRTGLYGYDGSYGNVFVGQSYRFDDEDNPFPDGSGLSRQSSDVVGQIAGRYKDQYTLDYRFQLSSAHLTSQRHEIDASADWNRFRLSSRYLFAKALEGTGIQESREQIDGKAQFYITPVWRVHSGATHDFGENKGLRQVYAGLDYLGECLSLSLTGAKNYTTEASGENGTEILFRVGLKNIGGYERSGYRRPKNASRCSFQ